MFPLRVIFLSLIPVMLIIGGCGKPLPDFSYSPAQPKVGTSVIFDASHSKPSESSAPIQDYQWKFGDNTTATGLTAEHTYQQAGQYSVQLLVTDRKNRKVEVSKPITIGP